MNNNVLEENICKLKVDCTSKDFSLFNDNLPDNPVLKERVILSNSGRLRSGGIRQNIRDNYGWSCIHPLQWISVKKS